LFPELLPGILDVGTRVVRSLGAAILAADCSGCRQPMGWGRYGVCEFCWDEIDGYSRPTCLRCGIQIIGSSLESSQAASCGPCLLDGGPIDGFVAHGPYAGRLRGIIQALKYRNRHRLARPLAFLIVQRLQMLNLQDRARDSLVVPVPLTRRRQAARGYNQAWLLARAMARRLRMAGHSRPQVVNALGRIRETPPQTGLKRAERMKSQTGLYRVRRRAAQKIRGRTVLLVDDVMTTGATSRACARILKQAGVLEVLVAVAARTPSPSEWTESTGSDSRST
jgi:ComF family protein